MNEKRIKWRLEQRRVSELIPYEKNPRIISKAFVKSCSHFNKPFVFESDSEAKIVSCKKADSLIKMMGGGH